MYVMILILINALFAAKDLILIIEKNVDARMGSFYLVSFALVHA
jgi:hypothetical protein